MVETRRDVTSFSLETLCVTNQGRSAPGLSWSCVSFFVMVVKFVCVIRVSENRATHTHFHIHTIVPRA